MERTWTVRIGESVEYVKTAGDLLDALNTFARKNDRRDWSDLVSSNPKVDGAWACYLSR